jgi:hypothetical protein
MMPSVRACEASSRRAFARPSDGSTQRPGHSFSAAARLSWNRKPSTTALDVKNEDLEKGAGLELEEESGT